MSKNETVRTKANIQDNYKTGALLILLSSLSMAVSGILIKAVGHLPLMETILFSNIPTMIIVPLILEKKHLSFWGNNKILLWFRSIVGTMSMMAAFYSIRMMSLTDATTIQQLTPLFLFFFAGIFLKEKLSIRQLPFFIFAFLGGLLVIKPGLRLDMLPALIALLGAIFLSLAQVSLRYLRLTDHYLVIVNFFSYISGLSSFIILLLQKSFQIPNLFDLIILTLIGGTTLLIQISLTKAFQLAPANRISILNYSQIIFATILSLLIFREIPDLLSIVGALLIIISGYLNYKYKSNH